MIPLRENELQYLNQIYAGQGQSLLILYGQKGIGKTRLILDFAKGKEVFYFHAGEGSDRQHRYLMAAQLTSEGFSMESDYPSWEEILGGYFSAGQEGGMEKKVLIIDEFDSLIRSDSDFMEMLSTIPARVCMQYMIVLCSSEVGFVENQLVSKIGKAAFSISGFLKVRPLSFDALSGVFSNYSKVEKVITYSILGGVPGLWKYFDPALSLKQNLTTHLLDPGCSLYDEGSRIVMDHVREGGVYYSILSALGEGRDKLGDIYDHTEFSRAKISVYLKNLMEIEAVEKVFSIDVRGRDTQRKGIYRISNPFLRFWFRFLYPHMSQLALKSPDAFYEQYIKGELERFAAPAFSQLVFEYMQSLALADELDIDVEEEGVFDGKDGYIDYLAFDEHRMGAVAAFACFEMPYMPYEVYERALLTLAGAKVKPDRIYLFARDGFDEKISLEAKMKDELELICMEDWME